MICNPFALTEYSVDKNMQKVYMVGCLGLVQLGGLSTRFTLVLTTHRLSYLCCQCDASLEMKLALASVVASTVVGEQPYKNRDMLGSDSGLGHLLVTLPPKSPMSGVTFHCVLS